MVIFVRHNRLEVGRRKNLRVWRWDEAACATYLRTEILEENILEIPDDGHE